MNAEHQSQQPQGTSVPNPDLLQQTEQGEVMAMSQVEGQYGEHETVVAVKTPVEITADLGKTIVGATVDGNRGKLSRRGFLNGTLLSTAALTAFEGRTPAYAEKGIGYDPAELQRIYTNNRDGYSFDIVMPRKIHGQPLPGNPLTVAIEGDSLSAITEQSLYNIHDGSEMEVWWMRLDPKLNLKFFAFAQGKSGIVQEGEIRPRTHPKPEDGTSGLKRIDIPKIAEAFTKADIASVSLGFNDPHVKNMSQAEYRQYVSAYMDKLAALRTQGGHEPSTTFFIDIWPKGANVSGHRKITSVIKAEARKRGFMYVDTYGAYRDSREETRDGIHYKGKAGDRIASRFVRETNLQRMVSQLRESKAA